MQQDEQTANDIFNRNAHSNIFRIKIPSHNASRLNLDLMAHAYVLNKLALLQFYQSQKLSQLYKLSLEHLINNDKEKYKCEVFVQQIIAHIIGWQYSMGSFGAWPYTRACFYSIQQKLKQSQQSLERVILQRGILQPNKQEFINKSQNMNFQSQELKLLIKLSKKQEEQQLQIQFDQPHDILYLDLDKIWLLTEQNFINGKFTKDLLSDYLAEYDRTCVIRYLKNNLNRKSVEQLITSLKLRSTIFTAIMQQQGTNLSKTIRLIQSKANKV